MESIAKYIATSIVFDDIKEKSNRKLDHKELIYSLKNDTWVSKPNKIKLSRLLSKELSFLGDGDDTIYNEDIQLSIVNYFPLLVRDISTIDTPLLAMEEVSIINALKYLKIWFYVRRCKKISQDDYILNKEMYKRDNKFDKLFK